MPGANVPLVLLPKFSCLAGATTFRTVPLDVNDYVNAVVNVWFGAPVDTSVAITLEELAGDTWTPCGGTIPGFTPGSTEVQLVAHLQKRWFRLVVELGGTDPCATCWAVGALERR